MDVPDGLIRRAEAAGVQVGHHGLDGAWVAARPETLEAVLAALGEAPAQNHDGVVVAWDGWLPKGAAGVVELEDGSEWAPGTDRPLPLGYHRIVGAEGSATVIAAPWRAPGWPGRGWGVFLPLYALRTGRSRGVADLTDLGALGAWARSHGAATLVTLPLLASLGPEDPSPYAPASRLFFNELYLDTERLPSGPAGPSEPLPPPGPGLIDLAAAWHGRRATLEAAAERFFAAGADDPRFAAYEAAQPLLAEYARFRAAQARHGNGWTGWPTRLPDGDPAVERYHRFVQWALADQLGDVCGDLARHGLQLGLDLPLGCHPDGFDTWWSPESFAVGAAAGAPPDGFFTLGQNWGFRPLSPAGLRRTGYRYLREALAAHLRHAKLLRIDHVMSLFRLWWIPDGNVATDGAYVRYPADELFAVVCLEAQRAGAVIVGENLGTVPQEVNEQLEAHGLLGMQLLGMELGDLRWGRGPRPLAETTCAFLTNHDTPPFAAWWDGSDIADRAELGLLDSSAADAERGEREATRAAVRGVLDDHDGDAPAVAAGLYETMAAGPAQLVVVSLEDLWGERQRQNTPGTSSERPNWRLAAALTLEEFSADPSVAAALARVDRAR